MSKYRDKRYQFGKERRLVFFVCVCSVVILLLAHGWWQRKKIIAMYEGFHFNIRNRFEQGYKGEAVAPISVIIPCSSKHWLKLPRVLESIAYQSLLPHETIVVLTEDDTYTPKRTLRDIDLRIPYVDTDVDTYKPSKQHTFAHASHSVPNLQLKFEQGNNYAGENRVIGASYASNVSELYMFFDCDDYMHPQRIGAIYDIFKNDTDIEALIHGADVYESSAKFERNRIEFIVSDRRSSFENFTPPWSFAHLTEQLKQNTPTWILNDTDAEPNWKLPKHEWHFPRHMHLDMSVVRRFSHTPHRHSLIHNAWLSIRPHTFWQVPYPNNLGGEDSLYVYRLIQSGKNFTYLHSALGAYIR